MIIVSRVSPIFVKVVSIKIDVSMVDYILPEVAWKVQHKVP